MAHFTLTQKAIKWLLDKVKDNTKRCDEYAIRLDSVEEMLIKNDFSAPIATDDSKTTLLITDDGYAILADWKYKEV